VYVRGTLELHIKFTAENVRRNVQGVVDWGGKIILK
jgi:hypothetical protein